MVEKVIISPSKVRAYGNIMMVKDSTDFEEYNCSLTESTDTINGVLQTVFVEAYASPSVTVSISASSNTIFVGGTVTLSATVLDEEVPVEGVSVNFKQGTTVIGSGTTNASGVATYTFTGTGAGSFTFSASYGSVSSSSVSVTVYEVAVSSVSLSSSESSIGVGESVLLTASVSWNDGESYDGETVAFYDGNTSLGTGLTDVNGVATLTASSLAVGSHSITASIDGVTSSAVSVVVYTHSYSLSFSQSSYVASGGSATLELTLLDNNVAVSGATVTVTGSDGSVYNGITNSQGVASVTVSNISTTITFTASYSNVSDTCQVIVSSYIFYDDATADNSSQYTSYAIQGTTGKVNIAWNSTEQAYAITNNTTSGRALLQFGNTVLQNNIKISADIKLGGSSYKQNGLLAFIDKDSQSTYSVAGWVQGERYYRLVEFNGTSELQTTSNTRWTNLSTSDYNHHELVYQNGVVTYTITNPSSQTKTVSLTLQNSNYVSGKLGLFIEVFSSATHCYIKNIKVEAL